MSVELSVIRFDQRMQNFKKCVNLLSRQSQRPGFGEENVAATLHFFEMTFELAWKLLKDYLSVEGIEINSPRAVIKESFSMGVISQGALWLEMLDARNNIAHTYEDQLARAIVIAVRERYANELRSLEELRCSA
ncbi:MAG: nucleotidyltransferase substrate binding protein [Promicromonosporaceae bacterium]|nr:nucleotidyltransferase substrate binding protein [Promicromonosporaceae bacterium]